MASTVSRSFPLVKSVKAFILKSGSGQGQGQGADCHDVEDRHWINGYPTPIANPMSIYRQYAPTRKSWGINALGTMVVCIEADDGNVGVGVSIGGEPGCYIVERHLSRFVEGQDPRDIELIWNQMYRATVNYGRKGLTLQAISAIDLALWDLLGRIREEPVYALLGGKTKQRLPVYCTTARPDLAKAAGFAGAKIPLPHGPAEGDPGLRKNVEFVRHWRDSVGSDFPLAIDCYMSLTVPYTIRLVRELIPYNIKWLEEFLHPDDYSGYAQVAAAVGSTMMLSSGEHEYTRYGFRQLIDHVDIVQPDVTWLGGLTEARRVVAMAAASDKLVIPHGSSVYSYHLQYAFANCPVAEYINLSPLADTIAPYFGDLFFDEPKPKDGYIDLPANRPGFGLTLDYSKLARPYNRTDEESKTQAEKNINNAKLEQSRTDAAVLPF